MPPGRPASTRGIYSLQDDVLAVPNEVVLDTSFVVDALLPNEDHHEACANFLLRLAGQGSVVFFNRLLEIELYETTYKLAIVERFGRSEYRWRRYDGRVRRRANRLTQNMLDAWDGVLVALNWAVIELDEVADEVPTLMARYGLPSYDAVHAATAEYLGVQNLVTLDRGFTCVPASQLTLYVNAARVSDCRRLRARSRTP